MKWRTQSLHIYFARPCLPKRKPTDELVLPLIRGKNMTLNRNDTQKDLFTWMLKSARSFCFKNKTRLWMIFPPFCFLFFAKHLLLQQMFVLFTFAKLFPQLHREQQRSSWFAGRHYWDFFSALDSFTLSVFIFKHINLHQP